MVLNGIRVGNGKVPFNDIDMVYQTNENSCIMLAVYVPSNYQKIIKFMATNELVINTDKTQFTIFNRKDCEEKINIGKDEVTAGKVGNC